MVEGELKNQIYVIKMKLAALCSGGKDSSYALWTAQNEDHEISKLIAMIPERNDSWMFHKPDPKIINLFAKASGLSLLKGRTKGVRGEEVDDLKSYLQGLSIDGVISGTIASKYQRERIEKICEELNITPLTPLWKKDPLKLLEEMLDNKFEIAITSVSAEGFKEEWLGRKITHQCLNELEELHEKYRINIAGEGGEYETLVLNAPFFVKRIILTETERVWKGDRGYLKIKKANLI